MAFSIPDEKGRFTQPNDGSDTGNIFSSYNLDLDERRITVSPQSKILMSETANADFNGYAAAIFPYSTDGSSGKLFAISDKAFSTTFNTPTGTWTEETTGNEPLVGNTVTDGVVFNGLALVSDTTDIYAWNGTTWIDNYWTVSLGQSPLTTGQRHLMIVGSDGNLYVVDEGNKLYRVNPLSGATVSGAGTLDFSAEPIEFTCLARTSTRLFIGTKNLSGNEAYIIEWDMSPSSTNANRTHKIGESAVLCIAVKNDIPYAVLSDGTIKYFDNVNFVEYQGFQFPVQKGYKLADSFIHPNGWDVIDDNIHFLVNGRTSTQPVNTGVNEAYWAMPAGIWCLDPDIGLYHRFALGMNSGSQLDFGQPAMREVGALYAIKGSSDTTTKFLASFQYRIPQTNASEAVLVYTDTANTQQSRGHLITPFVFSLREQWKLVEIFNKALASGSKINVYSRAEKLDSLPYLGHWADTFTFNITDTSTGIVKGDMVFVKAGPGAGQWLKVKTVTASSSTTSLEFETANIYAVANDHGNINSFNFSFMGTIDNTTRDYHDFAVSNADKKRKRQFLFEFIQAPESEIEVDYIIVNT